METTRAREPLCGNNNYDKGTPINGQPRNRENKKNTRQIYLSLNVRLVPYKAFYFIYGCAKGALVPFVPLYFTQIGLNQLQIGVLAGAAVIPQFIINPVISALAEKSRKQKLALSIALFSILLVALVLVALPAWKFLDVSCTAKQKFYAPFKNKTDLQHSYFLWNEDNPLFFKRPSDNYFKKLEHYFQGFRQDHSNSNTSRETRAARDIDHNSQSNVTFHWHPLITYTGPGITFSEPSRVRHIFATFVAIILLGSILASPTESLADTATIMNLGENVSYIGRQKLWTTLSTALLSLMSGAFIFITTPAYSKCGNLITVLNFSLPFAICIASILVAIPLVVACFQFKHGADDETVYNVRKTLSLLENQHHLTLLVVFCIAGMCDGLVQCFLLWHVANFGGTPLFLGILTVVFYGSSILAFYTNHRSVQLVGHIWIFAVCLACLVVVFVSYAFINNPWYFLPAQFLVGVSRAAFQGVMISFFATNIPVSSLATVQGLVHGLYFGIGVGSGCVIGGALIQLTSPTMTFLVFAATAAVGLLLTVFVKICTKQPDYLAEEYTEVEGTNDEERAVTSEHRRR